MWNRSLKPGRNASHKIHSFLFINLFIYLLGYTTNYNYLNKLSLQKLLNNSYLEAYIVAILSRILGIKMALPYQPHKTMAVNMKRESRISPTLPNGPDTGSTGSHSYLYYSRVGAPGELVLNNEYLFMPKENPLYHLNTPSFHPCFIHNNILFNVKVSKS